MARKDIHEEIASLEYDPETDPEIVSYLKYCFNNGLDPEAPHMELAEYQTLEQKYHGQPWLVKWEENKRFNKDLDMGHYDSGELREVF